MAYRINQAHLETVLNSINSTLGQRSKAWECDEAGRPLKANVGTYVLDYAYGGVCLAQITNPGGGERNVTQRGTKRETYNAMRAFLAGVAAAQS